MRTSVAAVLTIAIFPTVASCSEDQECIEHPVSYYNQGIARLLTAKGVPNSVMVGRGVCFPKSASAQYKQAQIDLERYFYEVADTLRDRCAEAAYVEWATREKLPFEIHDTTSSSGPGRMINIYSFSAEEVVANRNKLSGAPRGKRCS